MNQSAKRRALIFQGGWDGHEPDKVADLFASDLRAEGFEVLVVDSTKILADAEQMAAFDLIVPCWTMGTLAAEESSGLLQAVRNGAGLAGAHGGMGDAFRGNLDYEWMTGGHFVGHPHVGDYTVRLTAVSHPITDGLPEEFAYHSEQYYLMVDPGITVLAETIYRHEGRRVVMPVAWTKSWGAGRVFYSALGHAVSEFENCGPMRQMLRRGLVWAARGGQS